MRSTMIGLTFVVMCTALVTSARAQQPPPVGNLQITVVDTTGAVIVGAQVTVMGIDGATKSVVREPVNTGAQGFASLAKLPAGRYTVRAQFPGFDTRELPDVRVRSGDNKQVVMLPVEGVKEAVVVEQNRQQAAADPRGPSFGTTLTREQIEALSDDPDTLRQQLQEMAGPGAVLKIDSFEGGALPPKAQIRSIRISRDQFAAEYHSGGGTQIEIITQPGLGPIRFNTVYRLRSDGLTGRSPFVPERGPEQFRNLVLGAGGTLIRNKSSFNVFFFGTDSYDTPNVNAALADGQTRSEAAAIRTFRDNYSVNGNVDGVFQFTIASLRNNTDGAFSIAPSGDQELEWGPANADVRQRLNISVNNQIVKNLLIGINLNGASAAPYTIRTGLDDNGDLIFNDRPAGVGRNTARGDWHWTLNTMMGYVFAFGRAVGGPPGIAVIGGGGAPVVQSVDAGPRYRLQFFVQTQNLTNRANYVGYSGTMTSPFFGQPTSVLGTRKVESGINFSF